MKRTSEQTPLFYITSNHDKFAEASVILEPLISEKTNFFLDRMALSLEEVQGEAEEIALHKTKAAFALSGRAAILVDDVSFYIDALNGFPGPYIKSFLEHLTPDGIWELVAKLDTTSCHVTCMIGFMKSEEDGPHLFSGTLYGNVTAPKGKENYHPLSWNSIFLPRGHVKTAGEYTLKELALISPRGIALNQFQQFLLMEAAD